MITVAEADRLLQRHARSFGRERVPLARAVGRVVVEEIEADRPYPPFDRVAMDGIAVRYGDLERGSRQFRIASTQPAGAPPHELEASGECVEIMTGAAMPVGADTVIRYEDLAIENGCATVDRGAHIRPRQNIHFRGSDADEGQPVIRAGTTLLHTHIAALASIGHSEIEVAARPRVAILTTGDELVEIEAPVLPYQIRQSNGYAVQAALSQSGRTSSITLRHVADAPAAVHAALGTALSEADVVLVTGGVSAGQFDLVPQALADVGAEEVFHRIRQKPGKPLWFGVGEGGQAVFGLPGNPGSVLVCLARYVLPFLAACAGVPERAVQEVIITELPVRKNDFTHFVPVRRRGLEAQPIRHNGSGDFLSILESDGLAEVSASVTEPGSVPFLSWTCH